MLNSEQPLVWTPVVILFYSLKYSLHNSVAEPCIINCAFGCGKGKKKSLPLFSSQMCFHISNLHLQTSILTPPFRSRPSYLPCTFPPHRAPKTAAIMEHQTLLHRLAATSGYPEHGLFSDGCWQDKSDLPSPLRSQVCPPEGLRHNIACARHLRP